MIHKPKSDYLNWIVTFGVIILLIEITFFNGGLLFSVFTSAIFIYFGIKKYKRFIGKVALLVGTISAIVTILNMFTIKIVLLAILAYLIHVFWQSKKSPTVISATLCSTSKYYDAEQMISKPLLMKQTFFGHQSTPVSVYEWNDLNIQHGVGDFVVDLSNTVLPKGESIISIRNIVGSIQILVPYEVEVEILHSVIVGNITILHNKEQRLFNQSIHYHTAQYDDGDQKVKIMTSTVVGNVEVRRI